MFREAFVSLGRRVTPSVLYPVVAKVPDSDIEEITNNFADYIPYTMGECLLCC